LPEARPRTLLLIPSYAKRGVEAAVADNLHPTMDYYALQARPRRRPRRLRLG
jgi:hypothetical protein